MDNIPLIKTKLIVPDIPDKALYSKRIKKLNMTKHRAVIISAPAGFGKTTAVLLSLKNERDSILWYRLEKEDSFLHVFYTHLIETLFRHKTKDTTDSARSLGSIGSISENYPLLNAVICQETWSFYPDSETVNYLIFDDFHNVATNTAIEESIKYFINNMPSNLKIIVISRVNTMITAGKLALTGDISVIGEEALRFTKEEIEKLTADIYKIKIKSDEIDTMYKYTEGWIAGITMLGYSTGFNMYGIRNVLLDNSVDKQNIFKYFLSEVLGNSNKVLVKKLAQISILQDFTCEDLIAVFNMEDASKIITLLEKDNLYIQKTNTKTAVYRFHSLFRSALNSVLTDLFSQMEINEMNLNAANHYLKHRDFNSAIRYFIAAGSTQEAIKIAATYGVQFMDAGDTDRVTSIIQEFPDELVQNNPYLLFLRGASLMSAESDQSFSCLHRALLSFCKSSDYNLQIKTLGLMIAICYQKNDLKKIQSAITLIPKFKAAAMSKYARVTLLLSAFMNAAWADKLKLGNILYKIIEHTGFFELLWDYTFKMAKGIILYRSGDLKAAEKIVPQILNHQTALTNDLWRSIGLASCHAVTSLMRDIEGSQRIVAELASIGEKYNSDYAKGYALRLVSYIKYQTRDIKGAVSNMDESSNIFARNGNPIMACVERITKHMWETEYSPAEPLTENALKDLNELVSLKPGQGFLESCQAVVSAVLKEANNLIESEKLLLQSYKTSKDKNALQSMCGATMHLADLYFRKNAVELEKKYLIIWENTASKNNYIYFREMNYPALVRVCARCIGEKINPGYMQKIISIYFGADAAAFILQNHAQTAVDPKAFISDHSLSLQKKKLIRIKLFGSFKMIIDNTELGENEWKTRKICGILKYILANPEKTVSREILSTLFWPESDSKAAFTSLRAALYELRKTLARFGLAFESEDALIVENKNGFQLSGKNQIETDTDTFSALYNNYKSNKLSSDEIKALLGQLVEIYTGDFLENDLYDDWIALSREHFRSMFIEASYNLAKIFVSDDESEQAETLLVHHMKIDPYDEKACSMLIHLYNKTGRENQADSLRRQFTKRFEAEMGVKPDLKYS